MNLPQNIQKVFGTSHVEYSDTFDGIEAIHPVSEQDFGVSKEQTCRNLYIDLNDYDEFSGVYEDAKRNNETVYLFRFDQSEYSAWEVTQGKWEKATQWVPNAIGPGGSFQTVYKLSDSDTNGYLAEEAVYLGLDLIQMEWDDGEKRVVIPIVSSPIDVVADGTPPVHTTSDKELAWWQIFFSRACAHSRRVASVEVRARSRLCGGKGDRASVQGGGCGEQKSKGVAKGEETGEGAGKRGAGGAIQAGHGGGLSRRLPERRRMGLHRGNVALGGRPMKTLKRVLAVVVIVVVALLIGYLIYTANKTPTEEVRSEEGLQQSYRDETVLFCDGNDGWTHADDAACSAGNIVVF